MMREQSASCKFDWCQKTSCGTLRCIDLTQGSSTGRHAYLLLVCIMNHAMPCHAMQSTCGEQGIDGVPKGNDGNFRHLQDKLVHDHQ